MDSRNEGAAGQVSPAHGRVPDALIEAYRAIAPGTLGHLQGIRFMDAGIKPVYRRCRLVGRALTVWAPGGLDIGILNEASAKAGPLDVVVVDRGGDTTHACMGEMRGLRQKRAGVAGWVIDGACTDCIELEEMGFPVLARAVTALIGKPLGLQGAINIAISCGGVIVQPGELVIADDNGVAVLSEAEAREHLAAAMAKEEAEVKLRRELRG